MPLPDAVARESMIDHRMKDIRIDLSPEDKAKLISLTERYSCADLMVVVKEAAMCPVRELTTE